MYGGGGPNRAIPNCPASLCGLTCAANAAGGESGVVAAGGSSEEDEEQARQLALNTRRAAHDRPTDQQNAMTLIHTTHTQTHAFPPSI